MTGPERQAAIAAAAGCPVSTCTRTAQKICRIVHWTPQHDGQCSLQRARRQCIKHCTVIKMQPREGAPKQRWAFLILRKQTAAAASEKAHAVASGPFIIFDPISPFPEFLETANLSASSGNPFKFFLHLVSLSSKLCLTCCVSFRQPFQSFSVYQVSKLSFSSLLLRFRLFVRSH